MAKQKYYGLYTRDEEGHWHYEFGDYDKKTVLEEQLDWLDHFDDHGRRRRQKDTHLKTWDQIPTDHEIMTYRASIPAS